MAKLKRVAPDIDSAFKFRLMCITSGLMHLTFLIEFIIAHMDILIWFNVVSVFLYTAASVLAINKDVSEQAMLWMISIFGEILIHSAVATVLIGTGTCFYLYSIMATPILVYFLFLFYDKRTCINTLMIFGASVLVVLTAVLIIAEKTGGLYNIPENSELTVNLQVMRIINIYFGIVMLFSFSLMFYIEVRGLFDGLQQSNDKLNYIATHDFLTGLANRRNFWDFYGKLEKTSSHYCIFMGDLDNFKKINDTYGHDLGDVVLKSVSKIILDIVGENDIACRWGGEEILVILKGSREECLPRVEAIKQHISCLDIRHEGKHVNVSMTFGFADCDEIDVAREAARTPDEEIKNSVREPNGSDIECLIALVDKRLYVGKRGGKNVIITA